MQGASRASLDAAKSALDEKAAQSSTDLVAVGDGLHAVVRVLDSSSTLLRALADPTSDVAARSALVQGLLASHLDAAALELLTTIVSRRWALARDLSDALELVAERAILLASEREGTLDAVEDELFRFARVLDAESGFRAALTDPGLPSENKDALLAGLLTEKVQSVTLRILRQVVQHPRGRSLEDALRDKSSAAADVRKRRIARVTSAVALDSAQTDRLAAALERAFGFPVQLQIDVDPDLLGGAVVRVGEQVIDGTTLRRLTSARRQFA